MAQLVRKPRGARNLMRYQTTLTPSRYGRGRCKVSPAPDIHLAKALPPPPHRNLYGANVNQPLIMDIMTGVATDSFPIWDGTSKTLAQLGYTDVGLDDNWQVSGVGRKAGWLRELVGSSSSYPATRTPPQPLTHRPPSPPGVRELRP